MAPDRAAAATQDALSPTNTVQDIEHAGVRDAVIPTWSNMPNKGQLAILALSRFVDFFQQAALQTYMVHQLKSFDPTLPDATIAHQAGMLQGSFTAAQILSSIFWGRMADRPEIGRKLVLNIGLIGTAIGCVGVGFSKSYSEAVFWRFLTGAINGTVGSARTMVAERTPKPWHARAFLLLPAAFNVANVAGPLLSGMLVNPYVNLASWVGPGSLFGGNTGLLWMKAYPYAAANLISTVLLLLEAILVYQYLEETLKGKQPFRLSNIRPFEILRVIRYHIERSFGGASDLVHGRQNLKQGFRAPTHEMSDLAQHNGQATTPTVQRLPFRRIWISNVLWTLLSIAIFDFHMGAFANLWLVFLATPRTYTPPTKSTHHARDLIKFSSGLAFPPSSIGFAMSTIGFIGIILQFLLYPWANSRFGLMKCFRASLFLFPAAYFLAPYLALLPSSTPAPEPSSGIVVWLGIGFVVFLQVAARTFALPASIILMNNSSPHPSVLGTIHGVGNACSATFRTIGPMLAGYWYGLWTARGVVVMSWWIVAVVAATGCVASFWVRNGSGHEIFLPGEEAQMKDSQTNSGSADGR